MAAGSIIRSPQSPNKSICGRRSTSGKTTGGHLAHLIFQRGQTAVNEKHVLLS
jgi:hypothetical protein